VPRDRPFNRSLTPPMWGWQATQRTAEVGMQVGSRSVSMSQAIDFPGHSSMVWRTVPPPYRLAGRRRATR